MNIKKYLNIKNLFNFTFVFITISIFIIEILNISYGRMPFWYDTARDLLLGLQNINNPTLIGQPTGLPGVFYGPYWIWLLSLLELINKSPRFIVFFALLIPYFTLFLYILLKMSKIFSRESSIIIWLLFIISFGKYFSYLWNPHLTPLFLLIFIFLMLQINFQKKDFKNILTAFLTGISLGLSANFSMSIGIGLIISTFIFLILQYIFYFFKFNKINLLNYLILSIIIFSGILITFAPFFLFEFRHGFNQIQSYIYASTHLVTGLNGLSDAQIILSILSLPSKIFLISSILFYIIGISLILILKIKKIKLKNISEIELRLLLLLVVISFCVLCVYVLSKNPIWEYHFIGFEIIFLLFLGVFINRHIVLKLAGLISVIILFIFKIFNFTFTDSVVFDESLKSKEIAVNTIIKDANNQNFTVFAFSPSIYTFEFDYLFKNRNLNNLNDLNKINPEIVYIIFEKNKLYDIKGFIESKTDSKKYQTTKTLKTSNGTLIYRREFKVN